MQEASARCAACSCCSFCFLACQVCDGQDETKHARDILGIKDTEEVLRADSFIKAAMKEEERLYEVVHDAEGEEGEGEEEDEEEDGQVEEDEGDEGEGEAEEDAVVLYNIVLIPGS